MGWRQKAWVKDEPCPKLLLRQKKGFLTRTEVFKTGLVEKYIHHVLHSDFLGQKSMFLMLTDDGKKLLLIFRGSFARSVPRNIDCKMLPRATASGQQQPELPRSRLCRVVADQWRAKQIYFLFHSLYGYTTLSTALQWDPAHEMQKTTNYKTYSKPLPRAYSYIKLHLHETLGLCIMYPNSHSRHSNRPLLTLLWMGILIKVLQFLCLLQTYSVTRFWSLSNLNC